MVDQKLQSRRKYLLNTFKLEKKMKWTMLGLFSLFFTVDAHAAHARRAVHGAVIAPQEKTAEENNSIMKNVNGCQEFFDNISKIDKNNDLLDGIVKNNRRKFDYNGEFLKDEFESTLEFEKRKQLFWQSSLVDPSRIVLDAKIEFYSISYDADSSTIKIAMPISKSSYGDKLRIAISSSFSDSKYTEETNGFGASVQVESYSAYSTYLHVPGDLYSSLGFQNRQSVVADLKFIVDADEARILKNNAHLVIWTNLQYPYHKSERRVDKATFDEPKEITYNDEIWIGNVKCAALTDGIKVVKSIIQ